jgi:hypothetical protein
MKRSIGFVIFGLFFAVVPALAQEGGAVGIGPRVTFQRGDEGIPDSSALRILGGQLKLRLTPGTAIEVSADYDSSLQEGLTQRVRSMPIQASLLVFPVKSMVAPYLLGGVGWYRQSITDAGATTAASTTTSIREMGYHAGVGVEVRVRRIAIHGDYRYNHIRFGGSGDEPAPGMTNYPSTNQASTNQASTPATTGGLLPSVTSLVPGLSTIQQSLKLSHQGSLWNWGVTFFF